MKGRSVSVLALGAVLLLASCTGPALSPSPSPPATSGLTPAAASSGLSTQPPATATNIATAIATSPPPPTASPLYSASPLHSASPLPSAACQATDQDQYVYNPNRLAVLAACIRVTGTVAAVRSEADGDVHMLIALDPAYGDLLTPANEGEELGDLVVEPVCVRAVTQNDAIATCQLDHDPLTSLPSVGMHIWLEGRYVHDLAHGGWSELHPLYRWGPA